MPGRAGVIFSDWGWDNKPHISIELLMLGTLNEGLKGFRANLKPKSEEPRRPWELFAEDGINDFPARMVVLLVHITACLTSCSNHIVNVVNLKELLVSSLFAS